MSALYAYISKIKMKRTINFFTVLLLCTAAIFGEPVREKWKYLLTESAVKKEKYKIYGPCGAKVYQLYYINNQLRMVKYYDYEGCATEYGNEYDAFYSKTGKLEFAYYLVHQDTSCTGIIFHTKTEASDHKCTRENKTWKPKTPRLKIPATTKKLMKTISAQAEEVKKHEEHGSRREAPVDIRFKIPEPGDHTIINGTGVRLRSSPGLEGKILLLLEPFQKVKVKGFVAGPSYTWAKVEVQNLPFINAGVRTRLATGYVSLNFLSPVEITAPKNKKENQ